MNCADDHYMNRGEAIYAVSFGTQAAMCPFCGNHGPGTPRSCHYLSAAKSCQHYIRHQALPIEGNPPETIDHPAHYGGADNPYEAVKVIEAWGLGFNLGNTIKYICRRGKKSDALEDLKKARWYLEREIATLEGKT